MNEIVSEADKKYTLFNREPDVQKFYASDMGSEASQQEFYSLRILRPLLRLTLLL